MDKMIAYITGYLYDYMIPICMLCLFRILVCVLQTRRTYKLRRMLKFHSVRAFYAEIGCWIGILIGSVLCCMFPKLWFVFMVLAAVLGVIGFKTGKSKGIAEDEYWREKGKVLIEEAKARGEYVEGEEVKTHGAGAIIQAISDDHKSHHPHDNTVQEAEASELPAIEDTNKEGEE